MAKLITFVSLLAVVNASLDTTKEEEINVCNSKGRKCNAKCTEIGLCLRGSTDKNYSWHGTKKCKDGEYCSCDDQSCYCSKYIGNCIPNSAKVTCNKAWTYPHPYDCKMSVHCIPGGKSEIITCPNDGVFDPCSGVCGPAGKCSVVTPLCKNPGDIFQVKGNDRLFFYCQADEDNLLHPVMDKCLQGFFDPSSGSCTLKSVPGCTMETISTSSNSNTPTSVSTPSYSHSTSSVLTHSPSPPTSTSHSTSSVLTLSPNPPTSTSHSTSSVLTLSPTPPTSTSHSTSSTLRPSPTPPVCTKEELMKDDEDCHKFYSCDSNNNISHRSCKTGYIFNPKEGCIPGSC